MKLLEENPAALQQTTEVWMLPDLWKEWKSEKYAKNDKLPL